MEGCRDQIPHNTVLRWTRAPSQTKGGSDYAQAIRREALRGTGVAALAAGVAVVPFAAKADRISEDEMRGLWQQLIDAEVEFARACHVDDEVGFLVRNEQKALPSVWTPFANPHYKFEDNNDGGIRRETLQATQKSPLGIFLVKEFCPSDGKPENREWRGDDADPLRWQAYPEAKSDEEAYAMSNARAEKEWRSHQAKSAAITRKHQYLKLRAAVDAASKACEAIRYEITIAPITGPVAIAVKLATALSMENDPSPQPQPDEGLNKLDKSCLGSVYRHAVTECGFDPHSDYRAAIEAGYDAIA